MTYFIYILIFVVGIAVGYSICDGDGLKPKLSGRAKERYENKNALLDKIIEKGTITNDEAQEFLGVSDSTATRYLSDLEEKGLVKQKGEGRGIYYEFIG